MFKVLNTILGTNTIWDFALQRSWFNQGDESKEIKLFCPCERSHKKWVEEEGLVGCCLSTFSSGEDLFQHVVHEKSYGSIVHLGLMYYLSILYEKETKPP